MHKFDSEIALESVSENVKIICLLRGMPPEPPSYIWIHALHRKVSSSEQNWGVEARMKEHEGTRRQ